MAPQTERQRSKSARNKLRRFFLLPRRYGITSKRFIENLGDMASMLKEHGIVGTFPITATVLARHAEIAGVLEGMEIAVHGRNHVDLTALTKTEQEASVISAVEVFREHGINAVGFRAPYLRCNNSLLEVLGKAGFLYDSSIAVVWSCGHRFDSLPEMNEALNSYGVAKAGNATPLNKFDIIELPVALPDDEILIDRLEVVKTDSISQALKGMVRSATDTHGHLVLQLHPERFHIYKEAMAETIAFAREKDAWIAPLREVAKWRGEGGGGEMKWPKGNPFAITISGDVDAATLGDFLGRRMGR